MKLYLGLALLATTVARKAPKKFESAKEMMLRPGPVALRQLVRARVFGTDRSLRADAPLENDRQEGVLPRGEDGVSPPEGVDNWY